ncbi:hypothetical protein HYQ45_007598 [Verticillium longisporum]|uniref:MAPEG family protein n=1 Tax=Verticillium longisporum TaxID=100787 RepID=A0A8I3ARM7_VERLO|nr:hypothetical protein HYQ44_013405 [Verticillium longisporum]KAG7134407.1 hypothetical protein HYQ45_007598 [Verticillium longisporum]
MGLDLAQTGLSFYTQRLKDDKTLDKPNTSANGFEALGYYAGGVVVANVAGVDASTINILSLAYVASRVFYTLIYVVLQANRKFAPLRTLVWFMGQIVTVTLLFKAAGALST